MVRFESVELTKRLLNGSGEDGEEAQNEGDNQQMLSLNNGDARQTLAQYDGDNINQLVSDTVVLDSTEHFQECGYEVAECTEDDKFTAKLLNDDVLYTNVAFQNEVVVKGDHPESNGMLLLIYLWMLMSNPSGQNSQKTV